MPLILFNINTEPPPLRWLAAGRIPAGEVTTLAGAPASGKSALAQTLAVAVASGGHWLGAPVENTGVLFICAEAAGSTRRRLRALDGGRSLPIIVAGGLIDLRAPEALDDLTAAHRETERMVCGDVGLVIVDALGSSTRGADENSGRDMGPALATLHRLADESGVTVLLLAHTGKGGDDPRVRGHSGILADVAAHLYVSGSGPIRTLTTYKLRDGEAGAAVSFRLVEDGEGLLTEVVEPGVHRPATGAVKAPKLADRVKALLATIEPGTRLHERELVDLAIQAGIFPPENPDNARRSLVRVLSDKALDNLIVRDSKTFEIKGPDKFPDTSGHV